MFIDCSKYAGKCACGREHTMETRAAVPQWEETVQPA